MFDFDDIMEQFGGVKQPKRRFKSTGIEGLDEAIDKVVALNDEIQRKGN